MPLRQKLVPNSSRSTNELCVRLDCRCNRQSSRYSCCWLNEVPCQAQSSSSLNPLLVFLFVTEASSPRFLSFYSCCRDSLGERHETRNATAAKTPDRRAGGKLLILRRQWTLNRDTNLTGCDPAFEYCTAREGMSESTVRRHGGGGQCAHSMGV